MKNYYDTLELPKSATDAQIKAAYRKLALKWHPDKNKSTEAHDKFKTINQAYETLSDPKKKQMYDQYGHDAYSKQGATSQGQNPYGNYQSYSYSSGGGNPFENMDFGGGNVDPFDIFESFFGFQGGGRGQRAKPREVYQISISFLESVKGVSKEVNINGTKKTIKIPAGVDNGNRIRFSDFDLVVRVASDKRFRREGQDIYIEQDISFSQAVLGGTIEIATVEEKIKIKVKAGTQPNSLLRLKDKGIPYPKSSRVGEFYIIFKVKIPEKVSWNQKKALEDFDRG